MSAKSSYPTPKLKTVSTGSLKANPHNPRMLFDEEPMKSLRDSIGKVGILVPLTVFKGKKDDFYTILDGQRRWICAGEIGLPTVPINEVAEPSIVQNIVTMFQIHKLRKDWELMPTALKLEVLMNEMNETRDKNLADLTGLNIAVVSRCKKLLSYPEKYRKQMLFFHPSDRIKADFFIELHTLLVDRTLTIRGQAKKDLVTDAMLDKYLNKKSGFKAITDFRKIKSYVSIAARSARGEEIRKKFYLFLNSDQMMISDLEIDAARINREASNLKKSADKLSSIVNELKTEEFLGEEDLWQSIESLLLVLEKKLKDADRRAP